MRQFLGATHGARSLGIALTSSLALALFTATPAGARITKIQITATESPTFGGFSWPGVGQYEKIVGKAFGEVNPSDPRNAVIVDIELAPRNARGNVEYSFNFYILKPIDLAKGAHRVMYEPPNRGGKTWTALGRVSGGGDDPGSITNTTVLANSFLMPRGYTLSWSGWEDLGTLDTFNASANFPIAKVAPTPANPTGTITGPSYEYIVVGAPTSSVALTYPAATLDKTQATLTHRVHLNDAPQVIPASGWNYNAAGTAISLVGGNFVANDIYEFAYTAKDPKVNGLGFAAVRDWNAWLRSEEKDDFGNPNPLAGDIQKIYTEISSQPGRMLNDFRHLGFNEAEDGRKVFDGHMQWIAAGNGINMNYRFSQSGRTERNRQNHLYIEGRFPFANVMTHDPITRTTDSRYSRCEHSNTCPLGVEIYSANEYWVKSASLLHTDPAGSRDLHDSQYTRNYFMSSMRHGTAATPAGTPPGTPPARGLCQQSDNPLNSAPVQRALFIALDEWATSNIKPPDSRVPGFKDGTLVPPLPQSGMGFPNIPSPFPDTPGPLVTYTGLKTTRYHFDYGVDFYQTGIATINPPVFPFTTPSYQDDTGNGPIYPSFIPKTDSDGNDIAGVRLPDVTVPVATYTGWALRRGAQANDGCEAAGQYIPFAPTEAARGSDPRPSVAARYPTFDAYYAKVVKAIDDMVAERLLLCEDAQPELNRLVAVGLTRGVPAATHAVPTAETFPHCEMSRAGRSDHFK
ncbi:MAG TPA: alpha/beta hydrolase domain-containing protein [Burkholderiales bacterium]|nr:alpha/beta hydrolase domain-containing protein [Burkholderiales bacterium]